MIGEWREWLYPLGFLSAIAFGSRMILQWTASEVKGKSIVMPNFWKLSLCGNILLAVHAFIQIQFHVCLIQACHAVISWRNLNLMKPPAFQASFARVLNLFFIASGLVFFAFIFQGTLIGSQEWFRVPTLPWQFHNEIRLSAFWHLLGFFGLALFSSRFWLQWWCAEKYRQSYLGGAFWWVSLVGEGLCLVYFLRINDPVNFIGPAFGMIPYIRNLMLIYRPRPKLQLSPSPNSVKDPINSANE